MRSIHRAGLRADAERRTEDGGGAQGSSRLNEADAPRPGGNRIPSGQSGHVRRHGSVSRRSPSVPISLYIFIIPANTELTGLRLLGFGIGAFFSLMSSSFAIEDPLRAPQYANLTTQMKVKEVFKDMGKGMWKSGSGFAKVGALYAGSECVIEGVSFRFYLLLPCTPHDPAHLPPRHSSQLYCVVRLLQ